MMAAHLLTREKIRRPHLDCQLGDREAFAQALMQQCEPLQMKLHTKGEPIANISEIPQRQPRKAMIRTKSNESTTPSLTNSLERISFILNDASTSSLTTDWPDTEPSHLTNGFKPSRASKNLERTWTEESIGRVVQAGGSFNPNFKSDVSDFWLRNQNCPDHLNCAIRIENIASDAAGKEIFDTIREGKVFSFSMALPKPGRFVNCAARLVFTTRPAAEAFIHRAQQFPGISLHGHRWRVWWNRDRCCPVGPEEHHQSRVLRIMGPVPIMSADGIGEPVSQIRN